MNKFFLPVKSLFDVAESISKNLPPQWLHVLVHTIIHHYSLMKTTSNAFNEFRKLYSRQLGQVIYLYDQKGEICVPTNMLEAWYL